MKVDLAKDIVELIINQSKQLNDMLLVIEEQCDNEEFHIFRRRMGIIMGHMLTEILNPLFKEHPDIAPNDFQKFFK